MSVWLLLLFLTAITCWACSRHFFNGHFDFHGAAKGALKYLSMQYDYEVSWDTRIFPID
jgi:hypothetical protein